MSLHKGILARRIASATVDWAIEFSGGILGSYFGALVAALFVAVKDGPAEQMQSSVWTGFGFGFVFWTLSVSFLNRVLIQGLSRSSIGKKLFKLELISTVGPLTWTAVIKRWIFSFVSFCAGGVGYVTVFFNREGRAFHDFAASTDIVPIYEGKTMSVEQSIAPQMTLDQVRQMLVLSNVQSERPMATVIQLPVRERLAPTGTGLGTESKAEPSMIVNEAVALAPVIRIGAVDAAKAQEAVAEEANTQDTKKKAA